jgi:hypothetical protein
VATAPSRDQGWSSGLTIEQELSSELLGELPQNSEAAQRMPVKKFRR